VYTNTTWDRVKELFTNHPPPLRSVVDSRTGQRAALKKIPSIHQSLLGCIRTFREVKILCELDNENVSTPLLCIVLYYYFAVAIIFWALHCGAGAVHCLYPSLIAIICEKILVF
jgi:hypothetical protein